MSSRSKNGSLDSENEYFFSSGGKRGRSKVEICQVPCHFQRETLLEQIHRGQTLKITRLLDKWPFYSWGTWARPGRLYRLLRTGECLWGLQGCFSFGIRGFPGACAPSDEKWGNFIRLVSWFSFCSYAVRLDKEYFNLCSSGSMANV